MTLKVGLIGCGNISGIYLENNSRYSSFNIIACADIDMEKAKEAATKYGIKHVYTVDEMMASHDIDIILNLTIPHVHAKVTLEALNNNKHVYSEKPIAVKLEDAKRILKEAKEKQLIVASAPDTFLGGSIQLAGNYISQGIIGEPIGASAFMMSNGPESWHPNPQFFYESGGGPMYDMGPYYISALISIFGPINRIAGSVLTPFQQRTITSEARYGEKIKVEIPTHVSGILDFSIGATATITTSFDVCGSRTPFIEIYGEKGTISLPDPNYFNQPLLIKKLGDKEWEEIQPEGNPSDNLRGIGLEDTARAIIEGYTPRASGDLALHVLEVMHGIHESSNSNKHYKMESSCKKPTLL
ncbi:Gfo/Idh/MocA family protein [Evansella cellulosilytica]|uniref:Oxidoreductase domain protein n=1 Tax=Evansella cellulosilytica (strain ATCC 21833 / DSM 2522 / FERM P-1141 / JCM 9156 / N-4) TaxID=649639 RepID=E6TQL4_EVAC2|nr:Gfo/Idh/MocA family oxidoreductase [Evansella cellulosilytica]ADU30525.1 oxidoreductase domain protein [Evansella cellulosilytica DSM 2522]